MKKLLFRQRKNCIICGSKIHKQPKRGFRPSKMRHKLTDVTCKRECSNIYSRVQVYIRLRMYQAYPELRRKK